MSIEDFLKNDIDGFLNYISDIVTIIDKDGTILKVNQAFQKLIQFSPTPFIGTKLQDAIAAGELEESAALRAIETKQLVNMNVKYRTGVTITWTYAPVFDNRGELALVIGTGRDITALVELESKLKHTETLVQKYSKKLQQLKESLNAGNIVYSSKGMERVLLLAKKIAKIDSPVIIWGETGVGKEMIAQYIHNASNRRANPFTAVNCAAIPGELLESEFFGYEEGSFTGAMKKGKKGIFEEAKGGIVFLDEVGELPLRMQSKLLRFLQEGKFMRIGGRQIIEADVRIISATNLTREQLMNEKNFRQDFFYRISVIHCHIPPLRERKDDIFPLIRHFISQFNSKYKENKHIPAKLMDRLFNNPWPGNVRELRNAVERLVALSEARDVSEEEFESLLFLKTPSPKNEIAMGLLNEGKSKVELMPLKKALQKVEEDLIKKAYQESGSIIEAANILGINASTIHRKLKKEIIRIR